MSGIIRIIIVDALCGARHFAATVAILEFGRSHIMSSACSDSASDTDSASSTAQTRSAALERVHIRRPFAGSHQRLHEKGLVLVLNINNSANAHAIAAQRQPQRVRVRWSILCGPNNTESGLRTLSGNLSAVDLRTRFGCTKCHCDEHSETSLLLMSIASSETGTHRDVVVDW